jgi:hypothetical protein
LLAVAQQLPILAVLAILAILAVTISFLVPAALLAENSLQ